MIRQITPKGKHVWCQAKGRWMHPSACEERLSGDGAAICPEGGPCDNYLSADHGPILTGPAAFEAGEMPDAA